MKNGHKYLIVFLIFKGERIKIKNGTINESSLEQIANIKNNKEVFNFNFRKEMTVAKIKVGPRIYDVVDSQDKGTKWKVDTPPNESCKKRSVLLEF